MRSLSLKLSLLITSTTFGLGACSDDGSTANDTSAAAAAGPVGAGGMASVAGPTTMGTATTAGIGGTAASSMGAGGSSATTVGPTSTTASSTTGFGGTTSTVGGMGGMGGMGMGGAGTGGSGAGGTANVAEDLDMTAEMFECIRDWDAISGFHINNLLGHLDEAKAVANNPAGGVYPVGTIIQHFPTEAMVKRRTGFSPESKDWEFFLLETSAGGTTIASRGTTDITTQQGETCVSCHSLAPDEYDFVCNIWADNSDGACGSFDFGPGDLDSQINGDPRCQ